MVAESGGVKPRETSGRANALTLEEREEIRAGLERGESFAGIAAGLARHRATIWREVTNNGGRDRYRAHAGERRADEQARRRRPSWTETRPWLWTIVQSILRSTQWSPEQISLRLRHEHPDEPDWWVSHESIYQAIYVQSRGELRRELTSCLRTGRINRRPLRRMTAPGSKIVGLVSISERPAEAEDRAVPGHWESQCCCQAAIGMFAGTGSV